MFRWFGYFWDALKALFNGVVGLIKMILDALDKLLEWLLAPFWLFGYAKRWRIEVGNPAATVATDIQEPAARKIGTYWSGDAANRYMTVVPPPQVRAANRIAELAKQISSSLNTIGGLGLGYLITMIGGIVVILKYIIATIAAIAGGVTAPAGGVTASIAYATWAGLVAASITFYATQDSMGADLAAEATNPTGFASGPSWPSPATLSEDVNPHPEEGDLPGREKADWVPQHPKL
jgi:hypothetical protein